MARAAGSVSPPGRLTGLSDTLAETHLLLLHPPGGLLQDTAAHDKCPSVIPDSSPPLMSTSHHLYLKTEPQCGCFIPPLSQLPWFSLPNSKLANTYCQPSQLLILPTLITRSHVILAPASSASLAPSNPTLVSGYSDLHVVLRMQQTRLTFAPASPLQGIPAPHICRICCLPASDTCSNITLFLRKSSPALILQP